MFLFHLTCGGSTRLHFIKWQNCKFNVLKFVNEFLFKCRKMFKVKSSMSCDAKNLNYVIKCKGCDEEYIGETGDTLRHRLTVHRQQIRDARVRVLYVSSHIANCARFQPISW